jgi:hypothetical protein
MKQRISYQTVFAPTAFVTKSKQRVKQYNRTVYLNSGDEFELELFNPTQSKVLAKIKLNGVYISMAGIVLRPGERVYLERYLDSARKFLFNTYTVSDDPDTRQAIEKNGLVEVEFYKEKYPIGTYYQISTTSGRPFWKTTTTDGNSSMGEGYQVYMSSDFNNTCCYKSTTETGRVEQGSQSNQYFTQDLTEFNSYYSWKVEWKILPQSQKNFETSDLVIYCASCGAKRKKTSHKFCPHCGTQF